MSMTADEIAKRIMYEFKRTNSRVDYVLDERWIIHALMPTLNPKEQDLVNDAINILANDGLVTVRGGIAGMLCLALTQKGFESIYENNEGAILKKIQSAIMKQFAKNNCRVGHTLDVRWLQLVYMQTLNPVEQTYVDKAVNNLVEKGYITLTNSVMRYMVLTQKGFDAIYD